MSNKAARWAAGGRWIIIAVLLVVAPAQAQSSARFAQVRPVLNAGVDAVAANPAVRLAAQQALGLNDGTLITIDERPEVGQAFAIRLPIDGSTVQLELAPHSVRAPSYEVVIIDGSGRKNVLAPTPFRTLRGTVLGEADARVAGSLLEDGLHLMIDLGGAEGRMWLQPADHVLPGVLVNAYALYHERDVADTDASCGLDAAIAGDQVGHQPNDDAIFLPIGVSCAELACDADTEYVDDWGAGAGTTNRIELVINTVNVQYENQVGITHAITTIVQRTVSDPYTSTDPEGRLCQFITEWTNNQTGVPRDVAHLFTGANIDGGVIGIAADIGGSGICTIQGSCTGGPFGPIGSYCLSQSDFNGNFGCATDLTAHELGHLWGAFHCPGGCPSNTMNPNITCANDFTAGSINSIVAYRNSRPCLDGAGCSPTPGACCFPDESCSSEILADCQSQGGVFQGTSSTCGGVECTPAACCLGDGTCTLALDAACGSQGGIYQGDGSTCGGVSCPQPGAGDFCSTAIVIPCTTSFSVNNSSATPASGTPDSDLPSGSPSCQWDGTPSDTHNTLWYEFVADDTSVQIDTCGTTDIQDTILALYAGSCGSLVQISCSEDTCGSTGWHSQIDANGLIPGNTYLFMVGNPGSWGGSTPGDIPINVQCPDPQVGPVAGACCLPGGSCIEPVTSGTCTGQGGTFEGAGSDCADASCSSATGACCLGGGSCSVVTESSCASSGGSYLGDTTTCSLDSDGDGTSDCADGCPNDINKTTPGDCGCGNPETDSDGDGTPDCIDGCPNDENKTAPGVCGCGVSDADTDGDTIPDCFDPDDDNDGINDVSDSDPLNEFLCLDSDGDGCDDCSSGFFDPSDDGPDNDGDGICNAGDGCPNDANKTTPGLCGCGVADTDSDGDGTPDCDDGCPNDEDKTDPGACGCGTPDEDVDNDGVFDCDDNCPLSNPDQLDCNGNDVGDVCDIDPSDPDGDGEVSEDLDGNGEPDECQGCELDVVAPTATCPANVTVGCNDPTDPGSTGVATASDACDPNPSVGFSDSTAAGSCPQETVITRTWTATDASGNSSSCDQIITVTDLGDPTFAPPADVTVAFADAGGCTAAVSITPPVATDDCDPAPVMSSTRSDGAGIGDPYPATGFGGPVQVTWTATDACGNTTSHVQTVTVDPFNEVVLDVGLQAVVSPNISRCLTFEFYACPVGPVVFEENVAFDAAGLALNTSLTIPCGAYTCVTVRDQLHSLRRTLDGGSGFGVVGTQFAADFIAAGKPLIGGNLNDDIVIDILDFGIVASAFGDLVSTSDCTTVGPHADINGNLLVDTSDFTFIQINFLALREDNCCGFPGFAGPDGQDDASPVTAISVDELEERGLDTLVAADLNRDGWLDLQDLEAFAEGVRPVDPASYVGPDGGSWFAAKNWSTGVVPGAMTSVELVGTVVVDGPGAVADRVTVVGGGGLELTDGTLVAQRLVLRGDAEMTLAGATTALTAGAVYINVDADFAWDGGTLEVNGGRLATGTADLVVDGVTAANVMTLRDGAAFPTVRVGDLGSVGGDGLIGGDLVNAGVLRPSGVLAVDGTFVQRPDATLTVGLSRRGHDQLIVSGRSQLAGGLQLELLHGFVPNVGDRYVLVEAAALRGDFDDVAWPALPVGLGWRLDVGPTTVEARVVAVPPGLGKRNAGIGRSLSK